VSSDRRDGRSAVRTTLDQVSRGDEFVVTRVDDERARVTAIRFGIGEGSSVRCVTKIPAGPIVLRSGRQEIAVGRELAKLICVRPCGEACAGTEACEDAELELRELS
jgi:ferrous iron transport protein A